MKEIKRTEANFPQNVWEDLLIDENQNYKIYMLSDNTYAIVKDIEYEENKKILNLLSFVDGYYIITTYNGTGIEGIKTIPDLENKGIVIITDGRGYSSLYSTKDGIRISDFYSSIIYDEKKDEFAVSLNIYTGYYCKTFKADGSYEISADEVYVIPFFGTLNSDGELIEDVLYNQDFGEIYIDHENSFKSIADISESLKLKKERLEKKSPNKVLSLKRIK